MSQEEKSTLKSRAKALRPGLAIGPANNNQDFWAICFGRPTAYVFLVLFADVAFITPNLLTLLSFALVAVSAYMIAFCDPSWWILAAILLQLNLTFDCADGQLARYRKVSSPLGSYLDKITDFLGFLLLFAAFAQVSWKTTGEFYYSHLALVACFVPVMTGYVKWIAVAETLKRGKTELDASTPVMETGLWWRVPSRILQFREPDIFLWMGVALCINEPHWALLLLGASQPLVLLVALVYRGVQVTRVD
jgi:phosphatidylglycerophosphate synthase